MTDFRRDFTLTPDPSPTGRGESSEQVRRNWSLLLQDIMFCGSGVFWCSPVHYGLFLAFLFIFGAFLFIYFTTYYMNIYEVVSKYEQHGDSMRQFAMEFSEQVNTRFLRCSFVFTKGFSVRVSNYGERYG